MKRSSVFLLLAFSCLACSKSNNAQDGSANDYSILIGSSKEAVGIGVNDGVPEGTTLTLPPTIEVVRRPNHQFDPSLDKLNGHMNTFYTDLHLVNNAACGTAPVAINLPKGLVFVNRSGARMQHGLLISDVVILVPPGTCTNSKDTVTVYLGLACLNKTKGLPWEENWEPDTREYAIGKDMHEIGKITNDANLLKLLKLFENKPRLKLSRHFNPFDALDDDYVMPEWMEIYNEIQSAIWAITDGPGLLKKEHDELAIRLKEYQ